MNLDPDLLYPAIASRDARFDGRFFTAVLTTGIYCRPICPARTPRRENVRFYSCAAAAESAGFRPCRRCRPETSPGSSAWLGTSSTVTRALRLIEEGALNAAGVDDLAATLGVGGRHLRRLFGEQLGASPLAIARTRRVHLARLLLDGSDLAIRDVAAAAGFSSVRRCQVEFRRTFGRAPSAVRAAGSACPAGPGVSLRLAARAPYDWDATLSFLERRAIPGVESVKDGVWRRAFRVDGRANLVEAWPDPTADALHLRIALPVGSELAAVVERVRRVFDLRANPAEIAAHLRSDSRLGPLVRSRPGLRLPRAWEPFEACVMAIVGQRISVKAARTILGRIVHAHGEVLSGFEGLGIHRLFPEAAALARTRLDGVGLSRERAAAIRLLARRVAAGRLRLDGGAPVESVAHALRGIPGIGEWTVGYVRMRGLGDPDVFLGQDLGVRRALAAGEGRVPAPGEVRARAESWSPFRSYAVLHLWCGGHDNDRG